ncbi:MAG: hypothetical protein EBX86_05695, partial [Actinobacteria bacterium]|nr:hypothetical protein [Actinomycetota bacterium]
IPLLLVNGASGIGTGSSCNVPSYNLITIIEWITTWLDNAGIVKHEGENGMVFYDTPELVPYFRGFKGTVEVDGSKITTYGVLNKVNETTYEVTELPIGRLNMGINKFKERLEKFREDKLIKKSRNISTDNDPHFIITVDKDSMIVTWNPAEDNTSTGSQIQYQLRMAMSNLGVAPDFSTVADTEANGTIVKAYSSATHALISNLVSNTTYYFNVIAKDAAGNKSVYVAAAQKTANSLVEIPTQSVEINQPVVIASNKDEIKRWFPSLGVLQGHPCYPSLHLLLIRKRGPLPLFSFCGSSFTF